MVLSGSHFDCAQAMLLEILDPCASLLAACVDQSATQTRQRISCFVDSNPGKALAESYISQKFGEVRVMSVDSIPLLSKTARFWVQKAVCR